MVLKVNNGDNGQGWDLQQEKGQIQQDHCDLAVFIKLRKNPETLEIFNARSGSLPSHLPCPRTIAVFHNHKRYENDCNWHRHL